MYKIAVIGGGDSVIGFKALGLDTFAVDNSEEARRTLHDLVKSGEDGDEYAIIYIEENMAEPIMADIRKYSERPSPAVILIPGRDGSMGIGLRALQEAVEKAVGSDIL